MTKPTGALVRTLSLGLLLTHAGCAVTGTYEPRPSPRISPIDATGYRVFVRDGQRHEVGLLGAGAEELVRGNDAAVTEARRHRRDRILASSFLVLGLGGLTAGTILNLDKSHRHDDLGSGFYFGALVPMVASIIFSGRAWHELANAINVYNDDLESSAAASSSSSP